MTTTAGTLQSIRNEAGRLFSALSRIPAAKDSAIFPAADFSSELIGDSPDRASCCAVARPVTVSVSP